MKVLLTGAQGQVGQCFCDIYPNNWQLITADHFELDISDRSNVEEWVAKYKPDVIVNAAAYTAVDKAETEYDLAYKVNVFGPENLALAAKKNRAKFIHISTDYVFDGLKKYPYTEDDLTNPINVYGKTKREGEIAVMSVDSSAIIIRTSWVFSEYGNNFVKTILKLFNQNNKLSIVDDQIGCPTYAGDLAELMIRIIEKNIVGGIYHYCGNKSMSWYSFAKQIITIATNQGKLNKIPEVFPVKTSFFQFKAKRPKYSVLDMKKLNQYGIFSSDMVEKLELCIAKIDSIKG